MHRVRSHVRMIFKMIFMIKLKYTNDQPAWEFVEFGILNFPISCTYRKHLKVCVFRNIASQLSVVSLLFGSNMFTKSQERE